MKSAPLSTLRGSSGALTSQGGQAGPRLRLRVRPRQPATAAQLRSQQAHVQAVSSWHSLTPAQRQAWSAAARARVIPKLTGQQFYVHSYRLALLLAATPPTSPPAPAALAVTPTPGTLYATPSSIWIQSPSWPAAPRVAFCAARPAAPGRTPSPDKFLTLAPPSWSASYPLDDAWAQHIGRYPNPGDTVMLKVTYLGQGLDISTVLLSTQCVDFPRPATPQVGWEEDGLQAVVQNLQGDLTGTVSVYYEFSSGPPLWPITNFGSTATALWPLFLSAPDNYFRARVRSTVGSTRGYSAASQWCRVRGLYPPLAPLAVNSPSPANWRVTSLTAFDDGGAVILDQSNDQSTIIHTDTFAWDTNHHDTPKQALYARAKETGNGTDRAGASPYTPWLLNTTTPPAPTVSAQASPPRYIITSNAPGDPAGSFNIEFSPDGNAISKVQWLPWSPSPVQVLVQDSYCRAAETGRTPPWTGQGPWSAWSPAP